MLLANSNRGRRSGVHHNVALVKIWGAHGEATMANNKAKTMAEPGSKESRFSVLKEAPESECNTQLKLIMLIY